MSMRLVTGMWRGLQVAALRRGRELYDLALDDPAQPLLYQSVWRARVGRIAPGLGTFVALGEGRTGLLKTGAYASGDTVVVQVKSLRAEGKADIVTRDVALPGRGLIYLPGATGFKTSRRSGRDVPASVLAALKEAGLEGGILRRDAASMPVVDLLDEALGLRAIWRDITAGQTMGLLRPGPVARDRLVTDHAGDRPTVDAWPDDLDDQLESLLQPRVDLGHGASLLVERAAALTAIDVNTGLHGSDTVNTLAITEIARHIRLRNLSGLIMIDFASGNAKSHRDDVLEKLRRTLADDPAGCRIAGLTPSGLVELTRPRRTPPLAEMVREVVS